MIYLLGAMVPMLLAQPEAAGERAHRVRTGLGPGVPAAAGLEFERRSGVRLLEGYGSTETNFVIATAPDSPRRGVMGWLQPGFDARIVDADDNPLPDDAPAEAGVQGAGSVHHVAFATTIVGHTRSFRMRLMVSPWMMWARGD